MLTTIEDIAQHFVSTLSEEDKEHLRNRENLAPLEKVWLRSGFCQCIRNEYSLWWDNPLTEQWRTNEEGRHLVDGIDYSKDHPDQVSADIFERVLELTDEAKGG